MIIFCRLNLHFSMISCASWGTLGVLCASMISGVYLWEVRVVKPGTDLVVSHQLWRWERHTFWKSCLLRAKLLCWMLSSILEFSQLFGARCASGDMVQDVGVVKGPGSDLHQYFSARTANAVWIGIILFHMAVLCQQQLRFSRVHVFRKVPGRVVLLNLIPLFFHPLRRLFAA